MIPYYGNWKLRKGDTGISETPFGYCYFNVLQVKSDGRLFCRLIPVDTTNKTLSDIIGRISFCRVINLSYGYWKLL